MLSEAKRHELIALIVAGYSRYAAAQKVGCARSTIYRLAARDPVFGDRLAEAEELAGGPDTRAFLQQPKHWREAARVLQQINPEDFRLRRRRQVPSTSFSLRGEAELFGELMEMVLPAVSDDVYSLLIREINKLLAGYDACDVPQLEDATKTEFASDRPSHACATACLEGKQCSDSVLSGSWETLLALQA
ncbi:MAG: helix-turn-helix domain-containing protein, partial [Thermoguttaceae bacterium]